MQPARLRRRGSQRPEWQPDAAPGTTARTRRERLPERRRMSVLARHHSPCPRNREAVRARIHVAARVSLLSECSAIVGLHRRRRVVRRAKGSPLSPLPAGGRTRSAAARCGRGSVPEQCLPRGHGVPAPRMFADGRDLLHFRPGQALPAEATRGSPTNAGAPEAAEYVPDLGVGSRASFCMRDIGTWLRKRWRAAGSWIFSIPGHTTLRPICGLSWPMHSRRAQHATEAISPLKERFRGTSSPTK